MKNLLKPFLLITALFIAVAASAAVQHHGLSLLGMESTHAVAAGINAGTNLISDHVLPPAMAFALTAAPINRNPNPKNIGGLEDGHYYAFVEDILTWPAKLTPDFIAATAFGELVTIPLNDPFVMVDGKGFNKFPCTPEEGSVKSQMVGPHDSRAFENSTAFSNAGNNDPLRGMLAYTANKPVVIISKELNSTAKVIGTQQYPARLDTFDASNGGKVSDGNILKHGYKSFAPVPAPTYLAPIPLPEEE